MKNPFKRKQEGFPGPSLRPSSPPSSEKPMNPPRHALAGEAVNKPTKPSSAEKPMNPPSKENPKD